MVKEVGKYHDINLLAFNQADLLSASLPEHDEPIDIATRELLKHVGSISVFDIPEDSNFGGQYLTALKALFRGSAYNMEWLRSEEVRRYISKLLSEFSFDVVHIDTISLCVYADLFKGLPIVLNHHNFESAMLSSRARTEKNIIKRLYYRYEASRLLKSEIEYSRQSNLNLTCSDDDAEVMAESIPNCRFLSVPNGVDVSYFYPNASVEVLEKSIVIVGGLSWYPNREAVEYFIREIWPLIKARIPDMRVDVIGRGPTREMVKLSESDKSFHIHGFVDDVRDYLWRAHFYLCPIRTVGGTKLKILDALASGCCIIADPFACKGIKVHNGAEIVYAETPKDYVDEIVNLLENKDYELSLREAGPQLIRNHYSYTSIGKRYSDELDNLIARSRKLNRSSL
ncbi:glycosyltransferase family 4 protein [Marinobacter sp.]|uniref:glycosyltransferase family 4 protein n=1 Tax=Marinobacter sp. TaxID=50741 RepID=UPI00329A5039